MRRVGIGGELIPAARRVLRGNLVGVGRSKLTRCRAVVDDRRNGSHALRPLIGSFADHGADNRISFLSGGKFGHQAPKEKGPGGPC